MATTLDSARWWCPRCGIERTCDALTSPCACLSREFRREKRGTYGPSIPRKIEPVGDLFDQMAGFFQ